MASSSTAAALHHFPTETFRRRALSLYRQMYKQLDKLPLSARRKMLHNLRDSYVIMRYHMSTLRPEQASQVGDRFLENASRDLELLRDVAALPKDCQSLLAKGNYSARLYMQSASEEGDDSHEGMGGGGRKKGGRNKRSKRMEKRE